MDCIGNTVPSSWLMGQDAMTIRNAMTLITLTRHDSNTKMPSNYLLAENFIGITLTAMGIPASKAPLILL